MSQTLWKIVGASVIGFNHLDNQIDCQDYHTAVITPSGWLVAAVSDGAGSAPRSGQGARTVACGVVDYLATCVEGKPWNTAKIDNCDAREWIEDAIGTVRNALISVSDDSGGLYQFHATLVGVLVGPDGGAFFHIGDGAGCATRLDNLSDSVVSEPENGEYANETYFVTQDDWREHLRVKHFGPQYDLIALMTDGVTPFAMTQGARAPFPPFFEPLSKHFAEHSKEEGEEAIRTLFGQDRVRQITGDDKTLVWALRRDRND